MGRLTAFIWRWTKRALMLSVALLACLTILARFVDAPPPEQAAGDTPTLMGVPLVKAADDSAEHPAPAEQSLEVRVAEILSRADHPDPPEPWSATAVEQHAQLRNLYREFLSFKDSAEFRRYGFGRGGPFGAWQDRVVSFDGDLAYTALLFDRCELVPDDLRRHARDHMKGKSSPQVRADAAAWAACFPD